MSSGRPAAAWKASHCSGKNRPTPRYSQSISLRRVMVTPLMTISADPFRVAAAA